jgi:hypothetical protein
MFSFLKAPGGINYHVLRNEGTARCHRGSLKIWCQLAFFCFSSLGFLYLGVLTERNMANFGEKKASGLLGKYDSNGSLDRELETLLFDYSF